MREIARDSAALLAAHAEAEAERERLREAHGQLLAFARKILAGYGDGDVGNIDGGAVQDGATECGLLVPTEMTEACGDNCACAEVDDFPQTCYRFGPALAAPRATTEERGPRE